MMDLQSESVAQTLAIGRTLGQALIGGEVLALIGQLGTGKTHLVKGIAQGLEIEDALVSSPTFTLINEYEGRLPLYHIDAYRLDNPAQLVELGFEELCIAPHVTIVEWADRVWPAVACLAPIVVRLEHVTATQRRLRWENLPDHLRSFDLRSGT